MAFVRTLTDVRHDLDLKRNLISLLVDVRINEMNLREAQSYY